MGIVERLRLVAAWHTPGGPTPKEPRGRIDNVCLAAIAEIERQANLIERLKGYAVHDDGCGDGWSTMDNGKLPCTCGLTALIKEIEGE